METTLAFILSIIQLIMKYGIPGVISIIKDWDIGEEGPTLEQIQALKTRVPKPETYFEENDA